jgi:hypothetical protein
MIKIIINPFEKLSEVQLLILGILLTIGGSLLGYLFRSRFDGVLDMHISPTITLAQPFIDNAINTASLFILLYVLGLIVNKKTRLIDVLNTALIARSPFYLLTLGSVGGLMDGIESKIDTEHPLNVQFSVEDYIILGVFSMFAVAFLVWFVALLYNGFKTATNVKATPHIIAFGFSIILAEILSKILIGLFNY